MNVRFVPLAREELGEAVAWYLEHGGNRAAQGFEAAIDNAIRLLAVMPKLGTPAFGGLRNWPLRRHSYTLVYRLEGAGICVVAVAHQSRRPGYFKGRA